MTQKISASLISQRYGVSVRTVSRWVEAGILPTPMYINKRRYFDEGEIEEFERKHKNRDNSGLLARPLTFQAST
jgi:predicted site-specific integrase-resolvase